MRKAMINMSLLDEIDIFVEIVKKGGIAKAALERGQPKSTFSRKLSQLEERLGLTLIQRSTRKMRLTQEGEDFYQDCLLGLQQLEEAKKKLISSKSEPQGLLRITTPLELNHTFAQAIAQLSSTYPKLEIEVEATNRFVNLIEEGFDLALRAGQLADSTYRAKKLQDSAFILVASPKYLENKAKINHPNDLKQHDCIVFKRSVESKTWVFRKDHEEFEVGINGHLSANTIQLCLQLALLGKGIAFLPEGLLLPSIAQGKLVQLLTEWTSDFNSFYLVYPAQKAMNPKIQMVIDFLAKALKNG
jgi:DNA-binding transcriptional LysR family regulator